MEKNKYGLKCDQFMLVWKWNDEEVEAVAHSSRCVNLIQAVVAGMGFDAVFGEGVKLANGIMNYTEVLAFGVNGSRAMDCGYSLKEQNVGVRFYLTAKGLDTYLASNDIEQDGSYSVLDLFKRLNRVVSDYGFDNFGRFRVRRFDIAFDIVGRGFSLSRFCSKVRSRDYLFYERNRRFKNSIEYRQIDLSNTDFKSFIGFDGVETVYIGSRSGDGSFLRVYDKYKERIERGKIDPAELSGLEDWVRYEVEIKLPKEEGAAFYNCVSELQTGLDFYRFLAGEILDRVRVRTSAGRDILIMRELELIRAGRDFEKFVVREKEESTLEKRLNYLEKVFHSVMRDLRQERGDEQFSQYIQGLIDYQIGLDD